MVAPTLSSLMDSSRLPSIPAVAVQIIALVQQPDVSIDELSQTIERDPALAARVLKTANSGFYGRPRSVKRVRDAVVILGLRSVKTLALGFSLVGDLRKQGGRNDLQSAVWQRSLLTATAARAIATRAALPCGDEAFLGGLLHLLGVIALDQALQEPYRVILAASNGDLNRLAGAERARYGFDHTEAGAALAERWQLPEALVMAIRMNLKPDSADSDYREIVRCVAAGSAAADLLLSADSGGALTRFHWDCRQLFGIPEPDADDLIQHFIADADVIGGLLDLPETGITADEVLARANEALMQMTLESERENVALHAAQEKLTAEASTDALTGLANRRHLEEYLAEHFRIAARYGTPLSLMIADIDHFKKVNDTHGHLAGDEVLRHVAAVVKATVREADLCARYGGEEFVVVMPATTLEGAAESAERVRRAVSAAVVSVEGTPIPVTLSAGCSTYRADGPDTPDWLVKEADLALYEAKRSGRNAVRVFEPVESVSPWSVGG